MKRMTGVLLALLLLAGCAGSGLVPLQYSAVNAARGECPGSVSIIKFEDARGVDELGRDAKDHPVMASGDVAVWVSRAVYTELGNHGCDVRYHEIDGAFSADATIKGEVLEASLTPTGNTTWKASVRVRFVVERDGEKVYAEKGFAEVEKPVLPGVATREELLDEALGSVMDVVLPTVMEHLKP
ncbi:hypothetical protein [Salidesulfovibrio brasiliensis]